MFHANEFETFDEALDHGKSACFDFQIYEGNTLRAAWSIIGGLRHYHA